MRTRQLSHIWERHQKIFIIAVSWKGGMPWRACGHQRIALWILLSSFCLTLGTRIKLQSLGFMESTLPNR